MEFKDMRALVYHDFGRQKFNNRATVHTAIADKRAAIKDVFKKDDVKISGISKTLLDHFNGVWLLSRLIMIGMCDVK